MASKPTILLVPGSFSKASFYEEVTKPNSKYDIEAVDLRTVGKRPGTPPTMYDDAAEINSVATRLAEEGKDIVLIAHSYGGIPTSESLRGVSKAQREKDGKKGGVIKVAYMTALVPEVGGAAGSVLADAPTTYIAPDEEGWLSHIDPAVTAAIVFNDLSPEEGIAWVKKFPNHSAISFANQLTYAGYKDVPVSYLFCENDKCVPPAVQQKCIDNIEKVSGNKVDVTKIPTDHVPTIGAPDRVIAWFEKLAE